MVDYQGANDSYNESEREWGAMSISEMLKMVKWYQHYLHISLHEIPYFNCMKTVSCMRESESEREREKEREAMFISEMLKMVKLYQCYLCISQYEIPYFNCMKTVSCIRER